MAAGGKYRIAWAIPGAVFAIAGLIWALAGNIPFGVMFLCIGVGLSGVFGAIAQSRRDGSESTPAAGPGEPAEPDAPAERGRG